MPNKQKEQNPKLRKLELAATLHGLNEDERTAIMAVVRERLGYGKLLFTHLPTSNDELFTSKDESLLRQASLGWAFSMFGMAILIGYPILVTYNLPLHVMITYALFTYALVTGIGISSLHKLARAKRHRSILQDRFYASTILLCDKYSKEHDVSLS